MSDEFTFSDYMALQDENARLFAERDEAYKMLADANGRNVLLVEVLEFEKEMPNERIIELCKIVRYAFDSEETKMDLAVLTGWILVLRRIAHEIIGATVAVNDKMPQEEL